MNPNARKLLGRIIFFLLLIGATLFLSPILTKLQYSLFIGIPPDAPWLGVVLLFNSLFNVVPILILTILLSILYYYLHRMFTATFPEHDLLVVTVIYTIVLLLLTNPLLSPLFSEIIF